MRLCPHQALSRSLTSAVRLRMYSSSTSPPSSKFTAALIQLSSQADYQDNYKQCSALIRQAVKQGAQIVFTPENTTRLTALSLPFNINETYYEDSHPILKQYRQLATELGVWINIGSAAVRAEDDQEKMANRSFLLAPSTDTHRTQHRTQNHTNTQTDKESQHTDTDTAMTGDIVARYDKIHMFDVPTLNSSAQEGYVESKRIRPGTKAVVCSTPFGRIGMTICYDVRFPALYRDLALAGAFYITVPSAFTVVTGQAHWHTLLRARAVETGCFVLAAAQAGTHTGGRQTYGHSLAIDPWGNILGECNNQGTGIVIVDIDPTLVTQTRQRIPSLHNKRPYTITHIQREEKTQNGHTDEDSQSSTDKNSSKTASALL